MKAGLIDQVGEFLAEMLGGLGYAPAAPAPPASAAYRENLHPRVPRGRPGAGQWTRKAVLHYGPGPHPDGSPQSVHGGAAKFATETRSERERRFRDNGRWRTTPIYHQTTEQRWMQIQAEGLSPGGKPEQAKEDPWSDPEQYERQYAGANFSPDSRGQISMSYQPDGRYGSVTIKINPAALDPRRLVVFSDDAWAAGSERVSFEDFDGILRRAYAGDMDAQDDMGGLEVRYGGAIPAGALRRVTLP